MPGILTQKLGPLPTWGWLGIATAGGGAWYLWQEHESKKNGASGSADTTGQADVPEYVFQNYNQLPPAGGGTTKKKTKPKVNPGGPMKGGGGTGKTDPGGPYRHVVSDKGMSLDDLAAGRHTTAAEIISITEGSGLISKQNLAKFKSYVKGGTGKPMPQGLVYYTSTGPAEG